MERERRRLLEVCRRLMLASGIGLTAVGPCSAQVPAVAPQYDTTHVYVAPADVESFVRCFLGTLGGASTKQVVATVTPTPSSTTSQLLQSPVGTVSLFGFTTPIPAPFGAERTGWLVKDLDTGIQAARSAGAEVLVSPFPDPIGRDAVVRFPGGVTTQLYWHSSPPNYAAFLHIPDDRVYVSPDSVDAFLKSFLSFSGGQVVDDKRDADGAEIGRPGYRFRRVRVSSTFGNLYILVTDGILPWPYGLETTGYAVDDLAATLRRAQTLGATVLVQPVLGNGQSAMLRFPGGYIAELHQATTAPNKR